MRIMIALGGNALLERGERADADIQLRHVRRAAEALAPLASEHDLIVCHGNGPQVGVLAQESAADESLTRPYPLDVLVAETQGMIGYWLVQELRNAGVARPVVAMVTQTVIEIADPAFSVPTKFIGPGYDTARADRLAADRGWTFATDGTSRRRVVASPRPVRIIERDPLRLLLDSGAVVICGGGGGCPVVEDDDGRLSGVEAVVDKDLTAVRIALDMGAERLLLLTDVPAVMRNFGTPDASPIRRLDLGELDALDLPAGSMGPKIEACSWFTTATGGASSIGALADAAALLEGTAGTTVVPQSSGPPDKAAVR